MQTLNEKFMSYEETDAEDKSLIQRTPNWRSEKLNQLIKKLDERYFKSREKRENVRPMKTRKIGRPSDRSPPGNAPDWAVADSSTVTPELTNNVTDEDPLSDASSPYNSPSPSDYEEDPEMNEWISHVTGVGHV